MTDFDLDAILEKALNDFEIQERDSRLQVQSQNQINLHPTIAQPVVPNVDKSIQSKVENSSVYENNVNLKIKAETETEAGNNEISESNETKKVSNAHDHSKDTDFDDMDGLFDQLAHGLAEGFKDTAESTEVTESDQISNDTKKEKSKKQEEEQENGEEDERQYDSIINNVIQQLLNRDMMYEPTKLICEKFPDWIESNRSNLSSEEMTKYGKMYDCFLRIRTEYELQSPDFNRLTEMMFEVQQYGQPPAEIIQSVAPGMLFGGQGLDSFGSMMNEMSFNQANPSSNNTARTATTGNPSEKAVSEDENQNDDDDDDDDIPQELKDEIARKVSTGECPTM